MRKSSTGKITNFKEKNNVCFEDESIEIFGNRNIDNNGLKKKEKCIKRSLSKMCLSELVKILAGIRVN
jgi:hypothetical protein